MFLRKPLVTAGIAAIFGGIGFELAACSSGTSAVPPAGDAGVAADAPAPVPVPVTLPTCTTGGLTIAFNPMYSAYDGKHIFQVPALVVGSNSPVTWSADTSMVEMQADSERPNEILIQVVRAGKTTIVAQSSDGKCA